MRAGGKKVFGNLRLHFRIGGFSGLFDALRAGITNSPVGTRVCRDDCPHPIRLRIPSSDIEVYRQVFLRGEYDFRVKKAPKVIVDAGANIGLVTVLFANRFPDATIIALEPERKNFEQLRKNVADYKRVIPVQAALWHRNEEIDLIDRGKGDWAFRTEEKKGAKHLRGMCAMPSAA